MNNEADSATVAIRESRGPDQILKGFLAGLITAVGFGIGGFILVYDRTGSMGSVLFILLPFAAGFATGLVARAGSAAIASTLLGLLICTVILLITKFEGFVCVLMSAPLIAVGMTIGALLGSVFRLYVIPKTKTPRLLMMLILLILPLFLMGANSAERESRRMLREQTVTDVLIVDTTPDSVWNELKSMDRIDGSRPFLMKIGLPVPVSCKTEGEGVGGKRTCYFESGYIEEKIVEWNPPNSMKFEITASEVPGRPWLTFRDAAYAIKSENGHTTVTRSTTIVSRLSPAWYWARLEAIGVHTEHGFLLQALRTKLAAK
jgi:hypothetical protein